MADVEQLKSNPKDQLWEHLRNARFVMLGSPEPAQHMQPMAPQVDKDEGAIWFFTDQSSDLVKAVNDRRDSVHLCLAEGDYQACMRGSLQEQKSDNIIERYWSPVVAAWFEGGKDDPRLTVLKFTPKDAAIWASTKNPVTFAYEIAKANVQDEKPDIGDRGHVGFR